MKRIASWRAQKIRTDCYELINKNPELPIQSIPKPHLRERLGRLLSILKAFRVRAMTQREGIEYEKRILSSILSDNPEFDTARDALTRMARAAYLLERNPVII
jgi:hypothetical protein